MASVDGYTKPGIDALLAGKSDIGHTHPSSGGGGIGGIHAFSAAEYDYQMVAGEGTQIMASLWTPVDSYSHQAGGSYGFPDPPFVEIDPDYVSRIKALVDGWYSIRATWFASFPASAPTIASATMNVSSLDPRIVQYYPVCPPRNQSYNYQGNFKDDQYHTTGELLAPPAYCAADTWLVDAPTLWWNTQDSAPTGGTYPGPIPTFTLQITKVG